MEEALSARGIESVCWFIYVYNSSTLIWDKKKNTRKLSDQYIVKVSFRLRSWWRKRFHSCFNSPELQCAAHLKWNWFTAFYNQYICYPYAALLYKQARQLRVRDGLLTQKRLLILRSTFKKKHSQNNSLQNDTLSDPCENWRRYIN